MDRPAIGSIGRTFTPVAPTGLVEVGGAVYPAETSPFAAEVGRPPIPADRPVVVSGWRADDRGGVVLTVRDAAEPLSGPRPAPPPVALPDRLDDRVTRLERRMADPPAGAGGTILLFTALGVAAGVGLSCLTYRGPGLVINPCGFALWAAGGALVGVVVYLVRGPDGRR